jgi:hypothetical protein
MAGRQVDDDVWGKFLDLREKGYSVERAAKDVGVAVSTVTRQTANRDSRLSRLMAVRGLSIDLGSSPEGKRALEDFGYFRQRYMARASTPWSVEAANKITELLASPQKEFLVINIAPGIGKSTMFTHDLPAWLIARDRSIRIMVASRTEQQARMYSNRLRRTLERELAVRADPKLVEMGLATDATATMAQDFGLFKPANNDLWTKAEFVVQQSSGVAVDDKESTVTAYGMDSGFLGGRFDFIIWDDLVDKKTMRGDFEALTTWWENEAESRLEPGGLLILQGQRLASDDLYRYVLDLTDVDEEGEIVDDAPKKYKHIVYKSHYDDLCTGEHSNPKPWPQGCLLDPIRLPWRELQRVKANREDRFLVMYQQENFDAANQLVPQIWINGGTDASGVSYPGCWDEDRHIGEIPRNLGGDWFSVLTADPSPTKNWAVQWWLYNPETEIQYLLDLYRGPMDAPDFLDWNQADGKFSGLLDEWVDRAKDMGRPVTYIIVEQNAAQRFLLQYDHVKRWQSINGVNIVPHSTHRNKSDEEYGVQTLAPHYRYGRVRLPGAVIDGSRKKIDPMITELSTWPEGKTDDCVMAHWFLQWNAPRLFHVGQNNVSFKRPSWMGGSRWVR